VDGGNQNGKNPIAMQALLLCWFVITVAVMVVLPFSQNSWCFLKVLIAGE
jgi:hypothetical protein